MSKKNAVKIETVPIRGVKNATASINHILAVGDRMLDESLTVEQCRAQGYVLTVAINIAKAQIMEQNRLGLKTPIPFLGV